MHPRSGKSRMSQPYVVVLTPSPVQLGELVDVHGQLSAVDGHDQSQSDRHLAGGDDHHDQGEDLPGLAAPHAGERDQSQVGRVEHQLQAQEDDQRVGADEHANRANGEDDGRDGQVPADGHYQPPSVCPSPRWGAGWLPIGSRWFSYSGCETVPPPPSMPVVSCIVPVYAGRWMRIAASSPPAASRPRRRRASTTAPIAATISSSEATSNGNRYVVRNSVPMCFGVPKPKMYGAPLDEMPFREVPTMPMQSATASAAPNRGAMPLSAPPWRCGGSSAPPT